MAHHHHDSDSYYMDQICLIALAGAFGAVCLTLYFWQTEMLSRILATQFHPYILWSGIALSIMVLIRAAGVWKSTGGQPAPEASDCCTDPNHEHHHHHSDLQTAPHNHAGEHHHHHGEEDCCAAEGHDHAHHDQAWTPLKCLVLLAPIVFYLLGLPSTIQSARDVSSKVDMTREALSLSPKYASLVTLGNQPLVEAVLLGHAATDPALGLEDSDNGDYISIAFQELEGAAYNPERKAYWQGKTVKVRGQFFPNARNDHLFTLARWKMSCCANDAIQLSIIMLSREAVTTVPANEWVEVTGRVDFRKRPSGYGLDTYLLVKGPSSIQKTSPDSSPYLIAGQ